MMKAESKMYIKNIWQNLGMLQGRIERKKQVMDCLSKDTCTAFNVVNNEQKQMFQKLKEKYNEIRVHRLWSTRIGEYVIRYLMAVEDSNRNVSEGILDVFVLSDCVNHNSRLSAIMGRNICIIDRTNVDMWVSILCDFPKVEFTKYWKDYALTDKDRIFRADITAKYFMLTSEEEKEGEIKRKLMGLHGSFVCIASRDPAFLEIVEPSTNYDRHFHDYRDSSIDRLHLAAGYLSEKGIMTVRMGRNVKEKVSFNNCIDYANKYYDEFMDIFLMKECKFYAGDSNGVCILPMALNRPVALKNVIPPFLDGFGGHPQNPKNLYIFKKYYKRSENRFLSIREMMQVEKLVRWDGRRYAKLGIEVVENSEEEILDLVMEMNARIDGEWVETSEDIALQKKYQDMFKKWCEQEEWKENAVLHGKVGALFLRKNRFLLV